MSKLTQTERRGKRELAADEKRAQMADDFRIDPDFAAKQIVDNLRAMQCDAVLAREILRLCEARIKRGELRKPMGN